VPLRNVSWETYERLMDEREERRAPRFFYDLGVMELLSPSKEHETVAHLVALLVEELVVEWDLDVENAGSSTFRREDLERGFEPDECFYFTNIEAVRGKRDVDLDAGDPPPDLVFEADVTSPSLGKLPIYAPLGVAEIWRYDGARVEILSRNEAGDGYEAAAGGSAFLLPLKSEVLTRFVRKGLTTRRPARVREVREWALRRRPGGSSGSG
jgi:Uma2 family endonuclease